MILSVYKSVMWSSTDILIYFNNLCLNLYFIMFLSLERAIFFPWWRYVVDNWYNNSPLHTFPLSYSHNIYIIRILTYSRRLVSMFSLELDSIHSFVSIFPPALDHDFYMMFYQVGLFLLTSRWSSVRIIMLYENGPFLFALSGHFMSFRQDVEYSFCWSPVGPA